MGVWVAAATLLFPLLFLLLWLLLCLQEELWTQMLLKSLGFYIWRSCTITEGVVLVYTAWRSKLHLDLFFAFLTNVAPVSSDHMCFCLQVMGTA